MRTCAALLLAISCAHADDLVVTFDGPNEGAWIFQSVPYTHVEPTGGNPGAYLSGRCLAGDDCVPLVGVRLVTALYTDSDFTGDFRQRAVSSIGFDGILFDVESPVPDTPTSLILWSDRSTPFDFSDDVFIYTLGPTAPNVGDGWQSYDFDIPYDSSTLPAGWIVQDGAPLQGDEAWNAVITDVSQVQLYWNSANAIFLPPRVFDPGADNFRVTFELPGPPSCPADCDKSTGEGNLDILDFICFSTQWQTKKPYGDCNQDAAFDILDFVCYQSKFLQGCR